MNPAPKPRGSLLVWVLVVCLGALVLAGLISTGSKQASGTKDVDLSALIDRASTNPASIERVVFDPTKQEIDAKLGSGTVLVANYPTPQAQIEFQRLLQKHRVDFASKAPSSSGGGSAWLAVLSWIVPFLLVGAFIWFFMRRAGDRGRGRDPVLLDLRLRLRRDVRRRRRLPRPRPVRAGEARRPLDRLHRRARRRRPPPRGRARRPTTSASRP